MTTSAAFGGTPRAIPGKIEMEDFDVNPNGGSGQGFAYHDTTPANIGGAYRPTEAVDMALTDDGGPGNVQVGWTERGEWLAYTVNIDTMSGYELRMRIAHPGPGGTFHMEVDGQDVTGPIQIPDTGGFSNWQTITAPTASLPVGTHVIYMVLDSESGVTGAFANVNHFELLISQVLTVHGETMGVNGFPTFMLFVSYFGGLDIWESNQAQVLRDLDLARQFGFHGLRVFGNWWDDVTTSGECAGAVRDNNPLIRGDGSINGPRAEALKGLIDKAHERGLFIELALANEPVQGLVQKELPSSDPQRIRNYENGIRNLTRLMQSQRYEPPEALRPTVSPQTGYYNVIIDLQNEWNAGNHPNPCVANFEPAEIRKLRDAAKDFGPDPLNPSVNIDRDPRRKVMASVAHGATSQAAINLLAPTGVDFIAYHPTVLPVQDPPIAPHQWHEEIDHWVLDLRLRAEPFVPRVPIYLNETMRWRQDNAISGSTANPEKWVRAAKLAKASGAAGFTWHTREFFDWPSSPEPLVEPQEVTIGTNLRRVHAEVGWRTCHPVAPLGQRQNCPAEVVGPPVP